MGAKNRNRLPPAGIWREREKEREREREREGERETERNRERLRFFFHFIHEYNRELADFLGHEMSE